MICYFCFELGCAYTAESANSRKQAQIFNEKSKHVLRQPDSTRRVLYTCNISVLYVCVQT